MKAPSGHWHQQSLQFKYTQALRVRPGSRAAHSANGPENCFIIAESKSPRALGDVEVIEERFVEDGSIWTSAGISAGIDLMLAFIARTFGEQIAGDVQFSSEYFPATTRYGRVEQHPDAPTYLRRSRLHCRNH